MKRCKRCGIVKPLGEFYANPGARDGRRPECKQCTAASRKAWYRENRHKVIARVQQWREDNRERYLTYQREYKQSRPEQEREGYLRRTFGITLADYEALLDSQSGLCAICGRSPKAKAPLHVDHNHSTGEIRGLLCVRCNNALGLFDECPERFYLAADYLQSPGLNTKAITTLARQRALALRGSAA
jgi:hypothetical protein